MRYVHGHNARGVDRSGPRKEVRYVEEDRGYDTPCWIWQLRTLPHGYGALKIKGKDWLAHRWHYEQAKGPIPKRMHLDHLCRQRDCVNPDHLEPVTPMANARRGIVPKLTHAQAEEVHRRRGAGETIRSLAAEFGVSRETVRLLGLRKPTRTRRG